MATLEILDEAPKNMRGFKKVPPDQYRPTIHSGMAGWEDSKKKRPEIEGPECPHGYTAEQVDRILGSKEAIDSFNKWISGQTMMLCQGFQWDGKKKEYVGNECEGKVHGGIVYTDDFQRYMKGHRRVFD